MPSIQSYFVTLYLMANCQDTKVRVYFVSTFQWPLHRL